MSESKSRKYGLSDFFTNYFSNFPSMLLVNALFCIPLALFIGAMVLFYRMSGEISWFVLFLAIPVMSPAFAGLTNVCRKLTATGKVSPIRDFFVGIRSNWLFFLVNSLLLYALTSGVFVMTNLNKQAGSTSVTVYFVTTIITAILFLFVDFSAVVMAVSVELRFSDVLKNSFILIVRGFLNHLRTCFALLFIGFILYTILALVNQMLPVLIIAGVLTATVLPVIVMYTITYNSYQTIEKHIIMPYSKEMQQQKQAQLVQEKEDAMTIEDLEPLAKGDPEEYVFLNGKTVKRKTILKMIQVRQSQKNEE